MRLWRRILQMEHLHYDLVYCLVKVSDKVFPTWVTRSEDFKRSGESKMTFETYYEILRMDGEDKLHFIERMQLQDYFYHMFLLDYIICNRDRHGANIEVLQKGILTAWLHCLITCYPLCSPVIRMEIKC